MRHLKHPHSRGHRTSHSPAQRARNPVGDPGVVRRGMRASVLSVGDGALGFWKALGEVASGRAPRSTPRPSRP